MSTGLIIALIVIVVAVIAVAAVLAGRARGPRRGSSLKRRFGPEYDRAVARHDGDPQAAERELAERVERHGSLREQPLEPARRREYEARWTAAQERFVDSPREAVAEADRLLAELAGDKGFPDGGQYEEQLAALSVHHADHVHGYRRVHRAARPHGAGTRDGTQDGARDGSTEEMRAAMVDARLLFDDLVGDDHHRDSSRTAERAEKSVRHQPEKQQDESDGGSRPARTDGRGHLPWAFTRRHAKGS
ncbi:hypothetical protein [Streptomyces sp. NPDC046909]|uniref:hypothetical protein n=1 Tax=Streptomyces sp. NPDC046909 TaxID=3155617 RepID=UPI00340A5710